MGYVIVSEVIKNYYFNESSVSKFISSACDEFVDVCNTSSNIILLIPETGIKSNQLVSRKAYLYIKGRLSIRQILLSEISGAFIGTDITIICADDFAGTGSQVIETIIQPIKELISSHGAPINVSLFFMFAVAYQQALDNIVSQSTAAINISTFCGLVLSNKDKAFHSESGIFSNRDMRTRARHLLSSVIGTCLNPMSPERFGDLQSLIVFSDNVPDCFWQVQ